MSSLLRGFSGGGITRAPPKPSQQSQSQAWMSVPVLEAMLRAEVQASNVEASIGYFEQLMRRQRTPHAQVCVGLLQLCVTQAPRQALWVLEQMSYDRGLEVDDYTRIVRLFIMQRVETEKLSKFQEIGCEICTFHDEGMHEYFTSMSTLLNLELHEAVTAGGMKSEDDLSVSLITHKRQVDAIALLCKKGGMVTPLFPIVMAGMGGREGAQSPEEVKQLACADTGLSPPEAVEAARAVLATLKLNPSQERAVEAALTQRLTLVQGPPGTGKTRVACEMIKLWVRVMGLTPVLVVADSNVAVDNIGAILAADGVGIVRCGRAAAIRDDLHPYMADRLGGPPAVAAAEVVLATSTAIGGALFTKMSFPVVLMDEVAQATEPSVLVPITHGCRQLVLLGDHRQLRPTVVSDAAAEGGLRFSLFERLIKCGVPTLMLDTQYRMHPSLCTFPSAEFYKGRLQSGVTPEQRPQLRGFRWPKPDISVALVPSRSPEDQGGGGASSKRNTGEAQQLVAVLRAILIEGELKGSEVGVVTPYKAQVAVLRQMVQSLGVPGGHAVEVKSVDGFQGREKELILFSAVRSNRGGSLGFVSDARRLNVLLTRAKRGMIVVADPRTLVHSRRWAAWLSWVEKAGAVPGDRNWRMPSRPSRYRDASSDESDEDAMGRRIAKRRGDDDSDSDEERAQVAAQAKRRAAVRQEQRRKDRAERAAARAAEKAASGEADDEEDEGGQLAEEAKWREALLQQAKAADAEYEAAFAAQVERERRAAEARARGELTEEEKEERQAAEAAAAAAKARALEAKELPFAFVALPPTPYSPAEDAGLLAGDAILRFGTALKLDEVPAQIRKGVRVSLVVVEASGRQLEKHVVPRMWDQRNPHSLLGCQIVDSCPLEFTPHPALRDFEAKMRNGKLQKRKAPSDAASASASASASTPAATPAAPAAPAIAVDIFDLPPDARDAKRRAGEPASTGRVAVELADGDTLLPNWHAAKDSEGRLYFYCTLTGEVSWHKPLVRPRR